MSRTRAPALRIGLTGGIASGKSTVAKLFGELGAEVIDTDEIARQLVAPGSPALANIVERFGAELLTPAGALDRRRLRAIVFADEARRRELEAKRQQARIDHLLSQAGALSRAEQIRAYVAAARALNSKAPEPMTAIELNDWCGWALAQADRLDPVLSGAYKTRPKEPAAHE